MEAIARRDRQAFARLYDRFSPPIMAYCLRALHDRPDAEDLVVDIFAEVWERGGRYDPARSKPFTYLMTLTRTRLIDRLRGRLAKGRHIETSASQRDGGGGTIAPKDNANDPLAGAVISEQRSRVLRALESLTADQREVVELAFFDVCSHSEIARKLDRPLGTVKSRIRQAIGRLREILSEEDPA